MALPDRAVDHPCYGARSDISAARAAGFDEHVIKPAELAKLERILATRKPSAPD